MPYKDKIEISEIEPYLLEGLKSFIEEILNLTEIYGVSVKIPVAIPPKKYTETTSITMSGGASSVYSYMVRGLSNDPVRGIYQDEALLQESANERLNKIITLKKLGVISSISFDNSPLERREVSFYVEGRETEKLLADIERLIQKKEKEKEAEKENKKRENEIYYNEKSSTINLGEKSIKVSGWGDAICKVFFNNPNENKEIDFGEIVFEITGIEYQKSREKEFLEKIRQAVYRLNEKIAKKFNKKDYLGF